MEFLTILWSDEEKAFDVKEHEALRDAITYLIKNGANYDHQEIVKKVNWLPDGSQPHISTESPKNDDPGPPPGTINGPADQPQVIDGTRPTQHGDMPQKRRSIFDGVLPPQLIPMIVSDSD